MEPFATLETRVIPVPADNIDTDQILPARFLKSTTREGFGEHLFADLRHGPSAAFPLDLPRHADAKALLAGHNFGCGSSREHAVWALVDHGIRAVISTGFADIFRGNALRNGLLPVEIDAPSHHVLESQLRSSPDVEVCIDLESRRLTVANIMEVSFPVDEFARHCLLRGIDPLGHLMKKLPQIKTWEEAGTPRVDTLARDLAS